MAFPWLAMRISEERDRRERETEILSRLGPALGEMQRILGDCLKAYTDAFGEDSATLRRELGGLTVRVSNPTGQVRVSTDSKLPGFQVEREGTTLSYEI